MEAAVELMEPNELTAKKLKLDDDQDVMKTSSEASNENDDDDDEMIGNEDDAFDYDDEDDDYMFDQAEDDDDHYAKMQAHFDNFDDIPTGVEASFSWLNDVPSVKSTEESQHDHHQLLKQPACKSNNDIASSSSSSVLSNVASTSEAKKEDATEDEVMKKFENFKSFDIVDDFSDHHYTYSGFQEQQPPRKWTKKIHDEWRMLQDLPNTIFVRAYERRMDLLRAVIVGPAGTPYHDGLFVFDIHFPPTYPDTPPLVHYHSGGLRINPNLYNSGKVCLSLLNTWTGRGTEKWIPNKSTMLQVLVSIQALILNDKPFFNEPGYERYTGAAGKQKSKEYNENTFILSLKTMIYTLRRPPKHFEDLVAGHFRSRAHVILSACRAYMEGVEVGSMVDGTTTSDSVNNGSNTFKTSVGRMINGLVSNFSKYGATDCDQYCVGS
ncbi:putative ubiquitin-conjugating enzyme E2 38 [Rutidosis leptorrhynchoides]|uniref:putative ubiquitin-conjugating enzyme E2 38 n=1 Tax=Rutidosis leptorrhynchoides TaxID=125765 RepID=UPI003A98D24E